MDNTPVIAMQLTYEFVKSLSESKAPLNYAEIQHYMDQVNEASELVINSLNGEPDIFFHIFATSHAYLNDMLILLPESSQTFRFSPSFMAGLRESYFNFVDYFYLKSHPDDIPMKEKHVKESTQNPRKSRSSQWHETKNTQALFDAIAESENIGIPPHKASEFNSMVSKYVHNDNLDIHKINTPKNKELLFIVFRAYYFTAMTEYNPMLQEEYRKRYNKIPSICEDIDYQSRKTEVQTFM